MKVRIIGHSTDPYTWESIKFDVIVNVGSVEKAKKWARQAYCRAHVTKAVKVK